MKSSFLKMIKGPVPGLCSHRHGLHFLARPLFRSGRSGKHGLRNPYSNTGEVQTGLEDILDWPNLTHAQREQVEIMGGEALQLQVARGSSNLSVA